MTRTITVTAAALADANGDLRLALDVAIPHEAKHEIVVFSQHGRPMSTTEEAFAKGEDYAYAIEIRDEAWQRSSDELPEVIVHVGPDGEDDGLEVVVPTWDEYQEALADMEDDEDEEDAPLYALVFNGTVFGIDADRESAIADALDTGAEDREAFDDEDETALVEITPEIADRIRKGDVSTKSLGI